MNRKLVLFLTALCLSGAFCCGCTLPKDKSVAISDRPSSPQLASQEVEADQPNPPESPGARAPIALASQISGPENEPPAGQAAASDSPATLPVPAHSQAQWDAVVAEVDSLQNLSLSERARLLADLRQTDPSLWPVLMQYFRASGKKAEPGPQTTLLSEASTGEAAGPSRPAVDVSSAESEARPAGYAEVPAQVSLPPQAVMQAGAPAGNSDAGQSVQHALHVVPADERPLHTAEGVSNSEPQRGTAVEPAIHEAPLEVPAEASASPPAALDWHESLAEAIRGLEALTANQGAAADDDLLQARLRLLYLAAGRRDDTMKPISGLPPAEDEFWTKELFGLRTWLDSEQEPNRQRRATAAAQELNLAAARLGQCGLLTVRNLGFCTKVASYGVYSKFDKDEFHAGQQVLIYAEIENFKSESTDKGYHTALKASYQLFDGRGSRVDGQEFPAADDYCQNSRRDFFVRYFLFMPEPLYEGKYTLRLTVEDTLNHTVGEASADFTIKKK